VAFHAYWNTVTVQNGGLKALTGIPDNEPPHPRVLALSIDLIHSSVGVRLGFFRKCARSHVVVLYPPKPIAEFQSAPLTAPRRTKKQKPK
jgi:hypothetical protein